MRKSVHAICEPWHHAAMPDRTAQPFTFRASDVWMSEFRLLPADPRWQRANVIGSPIPLIAFPRTTVGIRHQGGREIVADATSVVLYAPGQSYRRRAITAVGDDCTVLALTPELAADAASGYEGRAADPGSYRFPFDVSTVSTREYAAIQRIRALLLRGGDNEQHSGAVREELYWVIRGVIAAGYASRGVQRERRHATEQAHTDAVEAVRERIGAELEITHPLDELAAAACLSSFHLARTFRDRTGRSIHAYRTELRLRASLGPIADGVRLADVAAQLGFASHAHLADRFRRTHGLAPQDWRNQLRQRSNLSKIMEAAE
jgi:AraC-like DNA-binding protein